MDAIIGREKEIYRVVQIPEPAHEEQSLPHR